MAAELATLPSRPAVTPRLWGTSNKLVLINRNGETRGPTGSGLLGPSGAHEHGPVGTRRYAAAAYSMSLAAEQVTPLDSAGPMGRPGLRRRSRRGANNKFGLCPWPIHHHLGSVQCRGAAMLMLMAYPAGEVRWYLLCGAQVAIDTLCDVEEWQTHRVIKRTCAAGRPVATD